jgi:tetratricopeptide (TPR) repeat protein
MKEDFIATDPSDIIGVLSRADELYRSRLEPASVSEAVTLLSSLPGATDSYGAQWRISRALFFLGQQAESRTARLQLHVAGVSAGERAASLNPERVEGRFWLGVNLALLAEAHGGLGALSTLFRARRELARAVEICEGYHDAGPLRVLARLYSKTPWFVGGSLRHARSLFERALLIAPANSVTLVYAAELALDMGDYDRARALLERVVELPVNPDWQFENHRDKELAVSVLRQLDG